MEVDTPGLTMTIERNLLHKLNTELEGGWEAKLKPNGRIYYINHKTQTSSWLPPRENWQENSGLPYGWETALDGNNKPYFINHVDKYTTRDDPRQDPDYVEPPRPREVELLRDQEKGFGFVAGSEKPVVVRFVTEGGPSVDKLLPGDLILKINGEEVRRAPREKVIELVRSCRQSILLTVCQPYSDNSSRKSAILTAAKKAKLKNNPSRVRFADAILVNGASVASQQSPQESYVPFMPNVLKVFLENGQTKSFKYDNKTTVKDVLYSLQEKLNITCAHHFSLVLQNMKSNVPGKMTLLQDHETLAELAAKPGARHFRCLFRVAFVPHDAYDLLKEDPVAFEYFYMQCCNDVIQERFASEMKYDTALRLAALQIQQHAMTNNMTGKISIKAIEKDSGLDKFVAHSLLENMKSKDLRKMLAQYMKLNQSLTAPGQKQLSALQAKLHYMKIISELKTFGSRVFMVTLLDQKSEAMILVGPKSGVSVVTNIKSYTLTQIADFNQIENIKMTKDGENMHRVDISVKINNKHETIGLGLLMEDAENFVSMVVGYYHIFVDRDKRIVEKTVGKNTSDPNVPSYEAQHRVMSSPWAYPEDLVSEVVDPVHGGGSGAEGERIIDLTQEPPQYEKNEEYLAKMKEELAGKATPTVFESPALTEALNMPCRTPNGQLFEEGVTSFGKATTNGGDSSSQDSSVSSQETMYKIVASLPNSFSGADSMTTQTTSHSTDDSQPPITLVTFSMSPPGCRDNSVPTTQSETSKPEAQSETSVGTPPIDTTYAPGLSNFSATSLGHDQNDRALSDTTSSTSSLSANEVSERQALLGDKQFREQESPTGFSALNASMTAGAKLNDAMDPDSDDADSIGTPQDSPVKGRQLSRNSSIDLALQSFGLHSPDTLPGADVDFQNMEDIVQITANGTVEAYNTVYSSQGGIGQGLYYDPDIIDLTNFPPPETPDDDSILDFTESNFPPPVFSSNSYLGSWNKNNSAQIPRPPPRSSSTPSRLERSASTGSCPDFLDDDIDALIAQFTIPPPPSSSDIFSSSAALIDRTKPVDVILSISGEASRDGIADDLSHLIIPPPPSSIGNSPQGEDIPVVPPVPNSLTPRKDGEKTAGRSVIIHKRSSSLDISFLRRSDEQFDSKSRSTSMDDNKNVIDSTSQTASSLVISSDISISGDSAQDITGHSPASISQKLHSLLQSLPSFVQELNQMSIENDKEIKARSLQHHRSSSLDLPVTQPKTSPTKTTSDIAKRSDPNSIPIFSRSSSLRLKWTPSRPRSQSCEPVTTVKINATTSEFLTNPPSASTKSSSTKELDKSLSGSESFTSVKAKLKEYRDFLLSRSKTSASKKTRAGADLKQTSESGTITRQRSGSFSKILTQFSRRGSKSDDVHGSTTLASSDANWELKEAKPTTQQPPNGKTTVEQGGEKRVPVVRDALGLNRPTLRPLSNTLNQTEARRNGPIKALQSAVGGDNNNSKTVLSKAMSQDSERSSRHQQHTQMSKDDILMTHSHTKEKVKANPYATTKMWRPTSTESSSTYSASGEDIYHTFTNFDALRIKADSERTHRKERQPTNGSERGHRSLVSRGLPSQGQISGNTNREGAGQHVVPQSNGYVELPADYSRDISPAPVLRKVSFRDDIDTDSPLSSEAMSGNASARSADLAQSPLMPLSPTLHPSSKISSVVTTPQFPRVQSSLSSSMKEHQQEESFLVVSDGTTNSVKLVLSHSYTDIELVGKDVERLLAELKLTMDSLKTSRTGKNIGQLSMCLSELHSQTKQFIQDAKLVVSSANNSHEKMVHQLEFAVHTLAHVFLHGQATMLLMPSSDRAMHLGFQLIKAANAFKSTVSAASQALEKALNDPNMKYLMRQAQNLASLLGSLINTIKEAQKE